MIWKKATNTTPGFHPGSGKIPLAVGQLSPCTQLLSLCTPESVPCGEKPQQGEARRAARSPHFSKQRSPTQQQKLSTAKKVHKDG